MKIKQLILLLTEGPLDAKLHRMLTAGIITEQQSQPPNYGRVRRSRDIIELMGGKIKEIKGTIERYAHPPYYYLNYNINGIENIIVSLAMHGKDNVLKYIRELLRIIDPLRLKREGIKLKIIAIVDSDGEPTKCALQHLLKEKLPNLPRANFCCEKAVYINVNNWIDLVLILQGLSGHRGQVEDYIPYILYEVEEIPKKLIDQCLEFCKDKCSKNCRESNIEVIPTARCLLCAKTDDKIIRTYSSEQQMKNYLIKVSKLYRKLDPCLYDTLKRILICDNSS